MPDWTKWYDRLTKKEVAYYTKEDIMAIKAKMKEKAPVKTVDNADNTAWTWVKIPVRAHSLIGNAYDRLDGIRVPVLPLANVMGALAPEPQQMKTVLFNYPQIEKSAFNWMGGSDGVW